MISSFFQDNDSYQVINEQLEVLKTLEDLSKRISESFLSGFFSKKTKISGVYLYGPPGSGKTVLMQHFYKHILIKNKKIDHFHSFMLDFHQKNHASKDSFCGFIKELKGHVRVLCLDEFFIDNIADAMILERFLKECVHNNIFIFLTSNYAPDDLYPKGLHRDRFLQGIEFLKNCFEIVHLNSNEDYRRYEIWPDNVGERSFSYEELFEKPYGTREYVEICQLIDQIIITDFPDLTIDHLDSLKRLIIFVDIFYLNKRKIKIPLDCFFRIDQMKDKLEGVERMASRLKSMMDK